MRPRSLLLCALLFVATPARAGSELVYVTPMIGVEYIGFSSAARSGMFGIETTTRSDAALAYGAHVGVVFEPVRLGIMFQRSELGPDGLAFNKLYLEGGFGGRKGILGLSATLAAGWTFFESDGGPWRDGGGVRVNLAMDFYLVPAFSIGLEAAADAGAFVASSTVYWTWGITGALRIGFHI